MKNSEVIKSLQPQLVFKYFAEISDIARGSGNTAKIANYLVDFAKKNKLNFTRDEFNNIIIVKRSINQKYDAIALQSHIDMVYVKKDKSSKDLTKEGIELFIDGNYLKAVDTSLGADDGIGVALMLSLLDSTEILNRDIYCIFTADEEVGMIGARNIDLSVVSAKKMINLDSEEQNIITIGCSSGNHIEFVKKLKYCEVLSGTIIRIHFCGGSGGHSGIDITKCRANANSIVIRLLYDLHKLFDLKLKEISGGTFDNVIPGECFAEIVVDDANVNECIKYINEYNNTLKDEYKNSDNKICISCDTEMFNDEKVIDNINTNEIIECIYSLPNGIIDMNSDFEDIPDTSLNLGKIKIADNSIIISYLIRSSIESKNEYITKKVSCICEKYGFYAIKSNSYPEWRYDLNSALLLDLKKLYTEMYYEEPKVEITHGGLECGILLKKMKDVEAVSIGPNICDVHSINEKLDIASVNKVYSLLINYLK